MPRYTSVSGGVGYEAERSLTCACCCSVSCDELSLDWKAEIAAASSRFQAGGLVWYVELVVVWRLLVSCCQTRALDGRQTSMSELGSGNAFPEIRGESHFEPLELCAVLERRVSVGN